MPQQSSRKVGKIFKFILMAFGLGIIGIIFTVIGALFGAKVLAANNSTGFAGLGLAIAGMIIGYPVGNIIGIILIKKLLHQKGSVWLGILGGVVGAVLSLLAAEMFHLNSNSTLLFGAFFLTVPVFSLIGFYLKK